MYFLNFRRKSYNLLVLYVQIVNFVLDVLRKLLKIQRSGRGTKQTFCMSAQSETQVVHLLHPLSSSHLMQYKATLDYSISDVITL